MYGFGTMFFFSICKTGFDEPQCQQNLPTNPECVSNPLKPSSQYQGLGFTVIKIPRPMEQLTKKVKHGTRATRMKSAEGSFFRLIFLEIRLGTY